MSTIKEMLDAKAKVAELEQGQKQVTQEVGQVQLPERVIAQANAGATTHPRRGPQYAACRLRRIIRSNGTAFMPTAEGVYEPQNEADYELCEYYVSAGVLERLD